MMRWITIPTALVVLALLSGCEFIRSLTEEPPDEVQIVEDPAAILLTEAALAAEAALATLAQVRSAENPSQAQPPPRLVPAELLTEVTLDWIGPLDALAERLAIAAGWDYLEAGPQPPLPLIVEVHAAALPIILVLRDAGIQAAEGATLTVDAPARQVRLDWSITEGNTI